MVFPDPDVALDLILIGGYLSLALEEETKAVEVDLGLSSP